MVVNDKIRSKSYNFVANLPPKSNQRMCKLNIADRKRVAHAWDRWDGSLSCHFRKKAMGYGLREESLWASNQPPVDYWGSTTQDSDVYLLCPGQWDCNKIGIAIWEGETNKLVHHVPVYMSSAFHCTCCPPPAMWRRYIQELSLFLVTASVLLLAIKGNESGRALSIGALNVGEDERGYKSGNNWISLSGRFIEGGFNSNNNNNQSRRRRRNKP